MAMPKMGVGTDAERGRQCGGRREERVAENTDGLARLRRRLEPQRRRPARKVPGGAALPTKSATGQAGDLTPLVSSGLKIAMSTG